MIAVTHTPEGTIGLEIFSEGEGSDERVVLGDIYRLHEGRWTRRVCGSEIWRPVEAIDVPQPFWSRIIRAFIGARAKASDA